MLQARRKLKSVAGALFDFLGRREAWKIRQKDFPRNKYHGGISILLHFLRITATRKIARSPDNKMAA